MLFLTTMLMLFARPGRLARWIGPLGLAIAGLVTFWQLPSTPPVKTSSSKAEAARALAEEVLSELPQPATEKRTLILPLAGDSTYRVTHALRSSFYSGTGQFVSVDDDPLQRLRNKWLLLWGFPLEPVAIDAVDEAQRRARRAGAEYAITGQVHQATADALAFDLAVIDARPGGPVTRHRFSSGRGNQLDWPATPAAVWGSLPYILGVAAFAILWPAALVPMIRRVLKVENNGLTLFALVIIAAVPIALIYPWAIVAQRSILATIGFVVSSLLIVLWCLFVTAKTSETVTY